MAETGKGKKVVYPYSYKRADGTRCLRTSAPPHTSEGQRLARRRPRLEPRSRLLEHRLTLIAPGR